MDMGKKFVEGLVSVIIPVYNASNYIDRTLNSVFSQTYKNIEIIIVDDCSTDDTAKLIKEYEKTHSEIIYYLQEKNMGAGYARNKALELAKGQYVAFLDSDDEWLPQKIEKQLQVMRDTNTPFVYAAIEIIDKDNKRVKAKRNIKETCDYNYLLRNTMIATSSVMINRNVLGDFRMHLRRGGQDYATWLKLLRGGTVAKGINEVLVRYRVSRGSLSSNKIKSIRQIWEIQTQNEKINKIYVMYHLCCFVFNALKKYLF